MAGGKAGEGGGVGSVLILRDCRRYPKCFVRLSVWRGVHEKT